MVRAEIPDPITEPRLWQVVTSKMMHGPCGAAKPSAACMRNGCCCFGYPKRFQEETTLSEDDSYPIYRRRNNGRTYQNEQTGVVYDNRHVAPYNPFLSLKYNCHINVEVCSSITAVKYICQYVHKGDTRAIVSVSAGDGTNQVEDEVRQYQDGRYIGASEASWRILQFPMHRESPNVVRLPIHLQDQQQVLFDPTRSNRTGDESEAIQTVVAAAEHTKLTRWFDFNKKKKDDHLLAIQTTPDAVPHPCLSTLYHDFPKIATWNATQKTWKERKKTLTTNEYVYQRGFAPIGRIFFVTPTAGERYFLRQLLIHVPGATSFENLRTTFNPNRDPQTVIHDTFKEACQARGLLQDDTEYISCMQEATTFASPYQLRSLFVTILIYNSITDPLALWNRFREPMSDDFLYRARMTNSERQFDDGIFTHTLIFIKTNLINKGRTMEEFNLPQPGILLQGEGDTLVDQERAKYNIAQQIVLRDTNVPLLNAQQRTAYDQIINAVKAVNHYKFQHHNGIRQAQYPPIRNCFFIDGLGGAGKTFLYNTLLSSIRSDNEIALAVASSGIAALLLDGGTTAHSRLKIPVIGLDQHSTCYIPKQSEVAKLLTATSLLLWDEAPMQHKHAFEAVDRTLRDLSGLNRPFGGVVVVMGGDFRQVLPVIPKGSRAQIVQASLNRSLLWNDIQLMRLHQNMRVQTMLNTGDVANATQQQEFSDWLKRIGEGTEHIYEEHGENAIRIPEDICVGCKPGDEKIALLDAIYGNLNNIQNWDARAKYIIERAILTPLNDDVDSINKDIAHRYIKNPDGSPINIVSYFSADTLTDDSDRSSSRFPTEYLNKFNLSGIPPHHLDLFVGCPVILLKNLTGGLANGTRLIITHLTNVLIRAKVTTGPSKGDQVLIPRLNHTPSNVEKLPFTLQRRQFPVRPAFGMTINKSQGQTFKKIGIYLPKPVFSHGQLYVALSRVGCKDNIRMMVKNGWKEAIGNAPEGIYTDNVVFHDVFRD